MNEAAALLAMSAASAGTGCPVCRLGAAVPFQSIAGRDYWRCTGCEARFLEPCQRLPAEDEYAHYLHPENNPDDRRYRRFLSRLADPLLARLRARSRGLDYGCGPGPALAAMLREAGHDNDDVIDEALHDH